MRTKYLWSVAACLIVGTGFTLESGRTDEPKPTTSVPRYTSDGDLLRPEGYRTWVFVGAALGLD